MRTGAPANMPRRRRRRAATRAIGVAAAVSLLVGAGSAPVSAASTDLLAAPVPYATGTNPHSVAVGDVNLDGKLDLVVGNAHSNNVSVLLGNGDGTFGNKHDVSVGRSPKSVTLADFDGDTRLDLAVVNQDDSTMSILLGDGTGTFTLKATAGTCTHGHDITTGDFDNDGKRDVAVACWGSSSLSIHLGNGDGTFQAKLDILSGSAPHSLVVGRFNADAFDDIAVANHGGDNVGVLLGKGNGAFDAVVTYGVGDGPHSIRAADLDADGHVDLAVVNDGSDTVSILLGQGTGAFAAAVPYATGHVPKGATIADIDGDGHLDVLTANTGGNGDGVTGRPGGDVMSLLLGNGNGTFQSPTSYPAGQTSFSITTGLLNADSKPDVVTANWEGNGASVMLNTSGGSGPPPPSDTTPPTVDVTGVSFRTALTASATAQPVLVRWTAGDDDSGLASFVVTRTIDGGPVATLATLGPSARSYGTSIAPGHTATFTVQARDVAGNVNASAGSARPAIYQDGTSYSSYHGTWTTSRSTSAIGGTTRFATKTGASATFRFTGRAVALVAPLSPIRGRVKVYVDSVYVTTVTLTSTSGHSRQVVFERAWTTSGAHTMTLIANGPSGHPRVDIDAWMIIR